MINRNLILLNKEHLCNNCGSKDNLEIDHIIPKVLNGSDDLKNLQILCKSCHKEKTNKETIYRNNTGFNRKPLTISIEEDLIKKAKGYAVDKNTDVSTIVEKLLEKEIRGHKK